MPEFTPKMLVGILAVFALVLGIIFFVFPVFSNNEWEGYNVKEFSPVGEESRVVLSVENGFLSGKTFPDLVLSKGKKNFLVLKNNDSKPHNFEVIHYNLQPDGPKTLFEGVVSAREEKIVDLPFLETTKYIVKCLDCSVAEGKLNSARIFAFSNKKAIEKIVFNDNGFEKKQYDIDITSNNNYTDETSPMRMFEVLNTGKQKVKLVFLSNNKTKASKYGFQPYAVINVAPNQKRYFLLVFTRENVFYNFVCTENCPGNARNLSVIAIK